MISFVVRRLAVVIDSVAASVRKELLSLKIRPTLSTINSIFFVHRLMFKTRNTLKSFKKKKKKKKKKIFFFFNFI